MEAIESRRTVVSLGPFLSQSIVPGSTVTGAQTLSVEALSPSWIAVDRLQLVQDGEVVSEVEGTRAQFTLNPSADAAFAVVAVGDAPMAPLFGALPWAMSSPVLVDIDGDGWQHPWPALQIED